MYCPQCGKDNTDNVKWCCWCGALLEAPEAAYAPPPVQAERESEPVRPAAPPVRKSAPSGGSGKHGRKSGPDRPPRRRKKRRGLLWLLLILLLLALLFFACMFFLPSFGGFVREHLPFRDSVQEDEKIASWQELIPGSGQKPAEGTGGAPQAEPSAGGQPDAGLSAPAQSEAAPAVSENWSEAYRNFVLNQDVVYEDYGSQLFGGKTFTLGSQRYYQDMYTFPKFSLHDMDADGVPELIAFNGATALAEKLDYVYTCRDNSILYLGTVGFRGCELFCYDGAAFPGLFCSEGNNGVYRTEYYTIGNDRIVTEHVRDFSRQDNGEEYSVQITADNALYALSVSGGERTLVFYTTDEIRAMGWESFVETVLPGVTVPAQEPQAQQGSVVSMTQEQQRAASLFLSNFAEQHSFEARGFDAGSPDLDDLVSFAYLYCKINRHSSLSVAQSGGSSYYTLSRADANAVWQRHFGITLSESEAAQYPQRDQSAYGQFRSFYSDGSFYFPAADGESYNRLAIARQMEDLGNGTYQVLFDIYKLDIAEYQRGNGSVDSAYYSLSADEARTNRNLTWQASGTAVVRPYVNNGNQTYQLVRYSVD